MADNQHQASRPTGKRQLTGASTTSSEAYAQKKAADAQASEDEKPGGGVATFLPEVGQEMKKVIWPTPKQMLNYTIIVFLFLIVMTALAWGVDLGTAELVDLVLTP
ncbi:MAG: preprotein translocase subunit SecE [Corynebacterium sp.]|nr:preprotein translocase subunit SecE [Corynebacterium sp.]